MFKVPPPPQLHLPPILAKRTWLWLSPECKETLAVLADPTLHSSAIPKPSHDSKAVPTVSKGLSSNPSVLMYHTVIRHALISANILRHT